MRTILMYLRMISISIPLWAAIICLTASCDEPPRAAGGEDFFYEFHPIELSVIRPQQYSLTKLPENTLRKDVVAASIITEVASLAITDESIYEFALAVLATGNLESASLNTLSYHTPCDNKSVPEYVFYGFVMPTDEVPGFPYVMASVSLWMHKGRAEFSYYFVQDGWKGFYVQDGWKGTEDPILNYPTAVSFQDALLIAKGYDTSRLEQALGEKCEIWASLRPNIWNIQWQSTDLSATQPLLDIDISAKTGQVMSIKRNDTVK